MWNARARNHIFEALDEELFDRVFALETAHEVWMQLKKIVRNRMPVSLRGGGGELGN
jgi:hypothetical protein